MCCSFVSPGNPVISVVRSVSQEINFVDQLLFGCSATHAAQDLIVGMLNRQIQVVTDFRLFLHRLNEFRIDVLRIAVQNPNPVELLNFAELF